MPKSTPRDDYGAKTRRETANAARRATLRPDDSSAAEPFETLSGVVLVAEPPANAGPIDALRRSLAAVHLEDAYVVWPTPDLLETLLSVEPGVLVAVGPTAAHEIDALEYPLVENPFSEALEGRWFSWTKGTLGLSLPALTPALSDDDAKRRFWRAFVTLRDLDPNGKVRA